MVLRKTDEDTDNGAILPQIILDICKYFTQTQMMIAAKMTKA